MNKDAIERINEMNNTQEKGYEYLVVGAYVLSECNKELERRVSLKASQGSLWIERNEA
jgi:hypothetical protein